MYLVKSISCQKTWLLYTFIKGILFSLSQMSIWHFLLSKRVSTSTQSCAQAKCRAVLSFLSRASTSRLLRARQLHLRGVAVDGRPVGLPQFRVPGVGPGTRLLVVDGAQDRLAQASPEAEELPHGATSQTQPPTSQTEGAPRRR